MRWTQGSDGLTRAVSLELKINYWRDKDNGGSETVEPPFDGAEDIECAMVALTMMEAMFDVLSFVRGGGLDDFEGGAETLENFGELGRMLASNAFSHAAEAEGALKKRRERAN